MAWLQWRSPRLGHPVGIRNVLPVLATGVRQSRTGAPSSGHTWNATCCDWSVELIAAHADHAVAINDRAGDDNFRESVATLDDVTRLEIVTAERPGGGGDDSCFATVFNHVRSSPGGAFLAILGHRVSGGLGANGDQIAIM